MKALITGGSGLLGSELQKIIPYGYFPSSSDFNILDFEQMDNILKQRSFSVLLHCAAFTSPPKINEDPVKAIDANIIGTSNIVKLCMKHNLKLVYISTDYVFDGKKGNYNENDSVNPSNKYAWSKLAGEAAVRMYDNSLIIRLSFGPKEFPFPAAFRDQWTSRESVDMIAKKITKLLGINEKGLIHIGSDSQTVFEYATKLNPEKDIKSISINDVNFDIPVNTSLDTSKYKKLKV